MIIVTATDDEMSFRSMNPVGVLPNKIVNRYPTRLETIMEVEEETLGVDLAVQEPLHQVHLKPITKSRKYINKHGPCYVNVSVRLCL